MLIVLNIISVSNYRSKRKKEILSFHVKTEERIGLHMTCIYTRSLTKEKKKKKKKKDIYEKRG